MASPALQAGTIGSLIALSTDDLVHLARGRLFGLFWFCGRREGIWIVPVPANDLIRDRRRSRCNGWNDRFGWLQRRSGWDFLTHVGDLKSVTLTQRILGEAGANGRQVRRSLCS